MVGGGGGGVLGEEGVWGRGGERGGGCFSFSF